MVCADTLLCRIEDLAEGTARGFDPAHYGRDTMFVVRQGGAIFAYLDACPHYGTTPMAWRKDAYLSPDGARIVCSAHGAQFEIATGACTLGACLGQSLISVPVVLQPDGEVHLSVPFRL